MRENLIEIKQDMPGFDHFFGAWVLQDQVNLLVDVGPAKSAFRLLESLAALGLEKLDYVLLTHIHIDHCGGLGQLLDRYPMAKVICHERSLQYLTNPSKLWDASLKILGEIAKGYGRPEIIQRERLVPHTQIGLKDLEIIETPGHSVHHLSFSYKNLLFVGEAGGNYLIVKDREYLRPATPPRFLFDVSMKSIDRLLDLDNQPICYAHFDKGNSSHLLLNRFREQLTLWKETIHAQMLMGEEVLLDRCANALLEGDPNLKAFELLDSHTQKRERFFMKNAIKGFVGFFHENG
jgi:glyoxylase-like metal-dependent hydrolase (beta-lactamase superfamily II)